jgi:AcrR family transcriptional regulator
MGTSERQQSELEVRRRAILDRSRDLFLERGYENVSVQDICDHVEYGRSAVYALFSSKEEIYAHVYLESMRIFADMFQSVDPSASDFDREFLKCMHILFNFFRYHRNYFKILSYFHTHVAAYANIPAHIIALKEKECDRAALPMVRLVTRGIESGYLKNLDAREIVHLAWASMVGIILSFIRTDLESDEEAIQRYCVQHAAIFLAGLKKT